MAEHLIPLLILALVIFLTVIGGGLLVWYSGADELDGAKIKRDNKGRRRSDQ